MEDSLGLDLIDGFQLDCKYLRYFSEEWKRVNLSQLHKLMKCVQLSLIKMVDNLVNNSATTSLINHRRLRYLLSTITGYRDSLAFFRSLDYNTIQSYVIIPWNYSVKISYRLPIHSSSAIPRLFKASLIFQITSMAQRYSSSRSMP